jgi:hypothetical protein
MHNIQRSTRRPRDENLRVSAYGVPPNHRNAPPGGTPLPKRRIQDFLFACTLLGGAVGLKELALGEGRAKAFLAGTHDPRFDPTRWQLLSSYPFYGIASSLIIEKDAAGRTLFSLRLAGYT